MKLVEFIAEICPVAKGRPRVSARGGRAVAYTPAKTRRWEAAFAAIAVSEMRGVPMIDEPVCVELQFFLPRPKRLMRRSDPDGCVWAATKPDLDNLIKACTDALSAHWRDDSLIVSLTASKLHAEKTGKPRVRVIIETAR